MQLLSPPEANPSIISIDVFIFPVTSFQFWKLLLKLTFFQLNTECTDDYNFWNMFIIWGNISMPYLNVGILDSYWELKLLLPTYIYFDDKHLYTWKGMLSLTKYTLYPSFKWNIWLSWCIRSLCHMFCYYRASFWIQSGQYTW